MKKQNDKVGEFWSAYCRQNRKRRLKTRWWQIPHIIRHINHLVNGEYIDGASQGLINKIKKAHKEILPFSKGISVGCADGQKEINLVKQGIVKNFELFELSQEFIAQGEKSIRDNSLEENIKFVKGDAFELVTEPEKYDLVHWNSALHHMPDVNDAVRWSRHILKKGGLFYLDDFVGASRFQWPDKQLEVASRIRNVFHGTKYIVAPKRKVFPLRKRELDTNVKRGDVKFLIENDPSEAADSEKTIDAIKNIFPDAEIIKTGGVVYHLTLSDMLQNFNEKHDKILLDLLMIIDELCIEINQNHYAVALAFKRE